MTNDKDSYVREEGVWVCIGDGSGRALLSSFALLLKTGSREHYVNNPEGTFNQWAINSSGLNQSVAAPPGSAGRQTSIHGAVPVPVPQTMIQQCEAPRLSCAINKNAIEPLRMLHHSKVSGTHYCIGNRVFQPSLHFLVSLCIYFMSVYEKKNFL